MTAIRVVIADDHPLFRSGLRGVLDAMDDVEVVAEAATGREAVDLVDTHRPDVVVMDIQMPDLDGVEATRRVVDAGNGAAVVMLTMSERDEALVAALRAGARGYLVKGADRAQIEAAVRAAARGDILISHAVADHALARAASAPSGDSAPFPQLSPREREVLGLLARGRTNPEIARVLSLSAKTVRNVVSTTIGKLGVSDRGEAIRLAQDAGLGR